MVQDSAGVRPTPAESTTTLEKRYPASVPPKAGGCPDPYLRWDSFLLAPHALTWV